MHSFNHTINHHITTRFTGAGSLRKEPIDRFRVVWFVFVAIEGTVSPGLPGESTEGDHPVILEFARGKWVGGGLWQRVAIGTGGFA
jgi:hypothetical protein